MAKSKKSITVKKGYEPTEAERAALESFSRRRSQPSPKMVLENGDAARLKPDHPEQTVAYMLLGQALGTADLEFLTGLIRQLANTGSKGSQIDDLNFMLSVIKGVEPRDQVEAMLAAQMAAVQMATMSFARQLNNVKTIPQQDSAERAFNKLARTFTTQMEALKRYRTGGEQKMTVQHVTVSEGGQAIVGNVTQSPREKAASAEPLALPEARDEPMPLLRERKKVPVAAERRPKK